MFLSKIIWV